MWHKHPPHIPRSIGIYKKKKKKQQWIQFVEASTTGLQNDSECVRPFDHAGDLLSGRSLWYWGVIGSVTSAPVCHAGVNVTVLALRLVGKVEFTLADKCVVFPISQFHYSSVMHSVDFSSEGSKKKRPRRDVHESLCSYCPKFLQMYIKTVRM